MTTRTASRTTTTARTIGQRRRRSGASGTSGPGGPVSTASPAGDVGSAGTGSAGTGSMDGDRGSDILAVVPDDPATEPTEPGGAATRRRDVVIAGHRGDE